MKKMIVLAVIVGLFTNVANADTNKEAIAGGVVAGVLVIGGGIAVGVKGKADGVTTNSMGDYLTSRVKVLNSDRQLNLYKNHLNILKYIEPTTSLDTAVNGVNIFVKVNDYDHSFIYTFANNDVYKYELLLSKHDVFEEYLSDIDDYNGLMDYNIFSQTGVNNLGVFNPDVKYSYTIKQKVYDFDYDRFNASLRKGNYYKLKDKTVIPEDIDKAFRKFELEKPYHYKCYNCTDTVYHTVKNATEQKRSEIAYERAINGTEGVNISEQALNPAEQQEQATREISKAYTDNFIGNVVTENKTGKAADDEEEEEVEEKKPDLAKDLEEEGAEASL